MPTSSKGNKAFIVMIDGLTRFAEARAFRNATALNGQRFMMDVMLRYGLPLCVTTDQGTHFSAEFSDLLQRMGFVMLIPRLTVRCQRESVERANGLILERIRRWVEESGAEWDQVLASAVFCCEFKTLRKTSFQPLRSPHWNYSQDPSRCPIDSTDRSASSTSARRGRHSKPLSNVGCHQR